MNRIAKVSLKILKWVGIVILSLVVLFFATRWIGQGVNKITPKGGINKSMYVDINGSKQWISIYGKDMDNPVLLYLHGGPGSASSLYDYAFTRKWADVYTVVTWDQRGCGKSYDKLHPQTITAGIMMQDGIDYQTNFEIACEYFKQVNAPKKQMFVMKDATHGLLESRSEEFSAYLHQIAAFK